MSEAQPGEPAGVGISVQRSEIGSTIAVEHTERPMRFVTLHEKELNEIGRMNAMAAFFFAVAGGALAFLLDIQKDVLITGALAPPVQTAVTLMQSGALTVLVISASFGAYHFWKARDLIAEIKKKAVTRVLRNDPGVSS